MVAQTTSALFVSTGGTIQTIDLGALSWDVDSPFSVGTDNLVLFASGGDIDDGTAGIESGGNLLTAASLALDATGLIDANTAVSLLAAQSVTSGDIFIENASAALDVNTFAGVSGILTTASNITLENTGDITITDDITTQATGGTIMITSTGGDIIGGGGTVITTGNASLTAASSIGIVVGTAVDVTVGGILDLSAAALAGGADIFIDSTTDLDIGTVTTGSGADDVDIFAAGVSTILLTMALNDGSLSGDFFTFETGAGGTFDGGGLTLDAGGAGTLSITADTITNLGTLTAGGGVAVAPSTGGASIGLGNLALPNISAQTFQLDDAALNSLATGGGTLTIGDGTSGTIVIDEVSFGAQNLILVTGSTINDNDDVGPVAFSSSGTLTLTSGGVIGGLNGVEGLNIDVSSLSVLASGGSDVTVRDEGIGDTTFSVLTGGAGAVDLDLLDGAGSSNAILSDISTTGSLNVDTVDGSITETAAIVASGLATFNAGGGNAVTLTTVGHSFGTLTFNSTGSVTILEGDGAMNLAGTNTAGTMNLNSTAGSLTDAGATSTTVTGQSILRATTTVDLGVAAATFDTGTLRLANIGGAATVIEDSATILSGIALVDSLDLDSGGSITDDTTADLTVTNLADFADTGAAGITLDDIYAFGTLTFNSTGAVTILEGDGAMTLAGVNTAGTLNLNSTAGSLSDAGATSTDVTGLGIFRATTTVDLGVAAATFDAGSIRLANIGGAATVIEDSATILSGVALVDSLDLDSGGSITDDTTADLTVTLLADFADTGGAGITLDDTYAFGTLRFNSTGTVAITEADDTTLSGVSTANSLDLDSGGAIDDDTTADLTVTLLADFADTGGAGITLDDTYAFGTLIFNSTGSVTILEGDGAMNLTGVSTGGTLNLDSAGSITDSGTANVTIAGLADFADSAGAGITLDDTYAFGSLTFNSTGIVTIVESNGTELAGSSTADTLNLTGAGLTDTGNVVVTGITTLAAGANAINLDSATNDFQGDVNLANTGANDVTINDANDLTIAVATVGNNLFLNIDSGANEVSTLDLSGATLTIGGAASAFTGQGTDDTLKAPNTANTLDFTGTNSGTFNLGGDTGSFSNFANFTGGTATDTFNISTGSATGVLDGGLVAATDTLGYVGGPAATIVLTGLGTVDGFTGTGTGIGGSFDNIDVLVGSANTDSLTGINSAATWNVDNSSFTSTNVLNFSGLENLIGGIANDIFNIVANHSGTITDLGGNDTINFNAGTLTGNTALGAGDNVYDYNGGTHNGTVTVSGNDIWNHINGVPFGGPVVGAGNLQIPNADNPSDLVIGPGGVILPTLTGFTGHLVIGGTIETPDLPLDGNKTVNINTGTLTVNSDITTSSNISLLGQDVDLNANIFAGGLGVAAGGKQLLIIASGDGSGDPTTGNITGVQIPTNIKAGNIILIAATNIQQPENIEIELAGGDAVVSIATGQEAPQFALFDANAVDADADLAGFLALDVNIAGIGAVLLNVEVNQDVGQANLAGALIGLEQLAFIDVGLFEEDLSLFGVIGSGVALALAQCEEVEGCAPDVTESELAELITALHARINELEKRLASASGSDRVQIEELLSGYRQELENFEGYKKQLEEYYSGDDDFDDDYGDGAPTVGDQIQSLGKVLEVAQARIDWLEGLKADPQSREKLSESTGIELTIESIDAIIKATQEEMKYIESQIKLLQDGTQAMSQPIFWAESGNYNDIHNVDYGSSLLSIGVDSLALNDNWY